MKDVGLIKVRRLKGLLNAIEMMLQNNHFAATFVDCCFLSVFSQLLFKRFLTENRFFVDVLWLQVRSSGFARTLRKRLRSCAHSGAGFCCFFLHYANICQVSAKYRQPAKQVCNILCNKSATLDPKPRFWCSNLTSASKFCLQSAGNRQNLSNTSFTMF